MLSWPFLNRTISLVLNTSLPVYNYSGAHSNTNGQHAHHVGCTGCCSPRLGCQYAHCHHSALYTRR